MSYSIRTTAPAQALEPPHTHPGAGAGAGPGAASRRRFVLSHDSSWPSQIGMLSKARWKRSSRSQAASSCATPAAARSAVSKIQSSRAEFDSSHDRVEYKSRRRTCSDAWGFLLNARASSSAVSWWRPPSRPETWMYVSMSAAWRAWQKRPSSAFVSSMSSSSRRLQFLAMKLKTAR